MIPDDVILLCYAILKIVRLATHFCNRSRISRPKLRLAGLYELLLQTVDRALRPTRDKGYLYSFLHYYGAITQTLTKGSERICWVFASVNSVGLRKPQYLQHWLSSGF